VTRRYPILTADIAAEPRSVGSADRIRFVTHFQCSESATHWRCINFTDKQTLANEATMSSVGTFSPRSFYWNLALSTLAIFNRN
jgi:hypothetical protein